jgi:hypothetical protein
LSAADDEGVIIIVILEFIFISELQMSLTAYAFAWQHHGR